MKVKLAYAPRIRRVLITGMPLLFIVHFFQPLAVAQAQPEYRVQWIGQFPGEDAEKASGLGDHLSRIVFGKKTGVVVRPFNVVASDPEKYWILDQGAGRVFAVVNGESVRIRAMRKGKEDFPSLVGMCSMGEGEFLFTDSRLNRIMFLSERDLKVFADSLSLHQPTGIAFNRESGEIWVVETGAHQISILNRKGQRLRTIGSRGTGPAQFNYPTFIWMDGRGRVYVVDSMNFRVQIFNARGTWEGMFGSSGDATGDMARPKGVATDSRGHIYVSDALFHAVQIFDDQGNFLYSFGAQGNGSGEFWMPAGIYIDDQDRIYVADTYNGRVQVFQVVKK